MAVLPNHGRSAYQLRLNTGNPASPTQSAGLRMNCDKLARTLPDARAQWTARQGVEQLYDAFSRHGVKPEEFEGPRFARAPHVRALVAAGLLTPALRWADAEGCGARAA
jgi:hypothetical protein